MAYKFLKLQIGFALWSAQYLVAFAGVGIFTVEVGTPCCSHNIIVLWP